MDREIQFGIQKLPPGCRVMYSEDTEHYYWVCGGKASEVYSTRWAAWRAAWAAWRKFEFLRSEA